MPEAATPTDQSDLALLIAAAREAGALAERYWRQDPVVWEKSDKSPVTEADLAVNAMLREELRAKRPGYGWLSEEDPDDPARLDHDRVFIVDPIDGTRAFMAGDTGFAHALAIAERGQVVAGVVFLPMRDEMFAAVLGGGATLNDAPLSVSDRTALTGAEVLSNKWGLEPRHWPGGVPDVKRHSRAALAHRLALVAQGRFDASLSFGKVWEWDSAAGTLMITEAGGAVSDRHGRPLQYNGPSGHSAGVLAAPPGVHAEVLAQAM